MAAVIIAKKNQNDHGYRREKGEAVFDIDTDKSQNIVIKPESIVRKGTLQKMVLTTEIVWQERVVTMNNTAITFSNVDSTKIIDYIPLAEITDAVPWGMGQQSSKQQRKNGAKKGPVTEEEAELEGAAGGFAFQLSTLAEGHNSGRTYRLKAASLAECEAWVQDIARLSKEASARQKLAALPGAVDRARLVAAQLYLSNACQMAVAALIILNFLVNAASSEILPDDGSALARTFEDVELAFTVVFTLELIVNLFVHWCRPFFRDSWNVFDLVVIMASLLAFAFQDLPGFSLLRLIRVFRVLRVFRRLQSLRRIINALSASVMPMMNAFAVLFLVTAIYAILGVSLYREQAPVHFGSFSAAMFTMFQVCTLDGWANEVARRLFPEDGSLDFAVVAFFVSFVIVVGIVILNVVVAVLLDEFVESVARDREERLELKLQEKRQRERAYGSPLDPVLSQLSQFNTSKDLSDRIDKLFQAIDIDTNGYLTADDLRDGLRKMQFKPVVHLSEEDFDLMTHNRTLCNSNGQLTLTEFEIMMRDQLKLYVQRQMAQGMVSAQAAGSQIGDVLFVLKLLMITLEDLKALALDEVDPAPSTQSPLAAGPRASLPDAFMSSFHSLLSGRGSTENSPIAAGARRTTEERPRPRRTSAEPSEHVSEHVSEPVSEQQALHDKMDALIALVKERLPAPPAAPPRLNLTSFSVRSAARAAPAREEEEDRESVGGEGEGEEEEEERAVGLLMELRGRVDRFLAGRAGGAGPGKLEVEGGERMVLEGSDWDFAAAQPRPASQSPDSDPPPLPPRSPVRPRKRSGSEAAAGPGTGAGAGAGVGVVRSRARSGSEVASGGGQSDGERRGTTPTSGGGSEPRSGGRGGGMPILFQALKKAPMAGISVVETDALDPDPRLH